MSIRTVHQTARNIGKSPASWGWQISGIVNSLATLANELKTQVNLVRAYVSDGMLAIATLAIGSNTAKFATTTAAAYRIAGATYTKAATDDIAFSGTSTINNAGGDTTAHFGAFLVQVNAAGTVSTIHGTYTSGTDQDYATEALAIAALPAAAANNVRLGYITVQGKALTKWTEATDDLTAGSDCTAAKYYNLPTPLALPAAVASAASDTIAFHEQGTPA